MTRPRDATSPERASLLLAFCAQPRTLSAVREKFGKDRRWRWALYNLVKRGSVVNLNAHLGRSVPGCFHAVEQEETAPKVSAAVAGVALQQAWGMPA